MKKTFLMFYGAAVLAAFTFAIVAGTAAHAMGSKPESAGAYYVCGCGPDCKCSSMSNEPGKCSCGKDMVPMHLLAVQDGKAIFCTCGPDCTCKLNAEDPTKCGCGKPVKVVDLKGKYVCGCGPDCTCNTISDKPGKCGCGKDLKLVE